MKNTQDKLTVRFPFGILDALRVLAKEHRRSLNSEIIWALQDYIQRQAKDRGK